MVICIENKNFGFGKKVPNLHLRKQNLTDKLIVDPKTEFFSVSEKIPVRVTNIWANMN